MNKNIIIGILVVVLALGGGLLIANNKSNSKSSNETPIVKDEAVMENNETPDQRGLNSNPSRYVEYSKAVLDQSSDKRRVLYFYATWCPTCKVANEDFSINSNKIPEDVVIIRTNYNDPNTDSQEKDLAKKYGITYQHTFVQIDEKGNEVAKWNGGQIDELLVKIK